MRTRRTSAAGTARTVRSRDASVLGGAPGGPLAIAVAVVVLLVLTAPELGRLIDFTDFRAFSRPTISGGLGNLRHQLSPLEALGIWPASDFRLSASAASVPAAGLLPRRAGRRSPRWRSACRAGSAATARRSPRRWPRRS